MGVTNAQLKTMLEGLDKKVGDISQEIKAMNGRQRSDHDSIQKVKTIQEKCPVVNEGWSLHNPKVLLMVVGVINALGIGLAIVQK